MRLIAIGGSDAGISAALRARELDPSAEVTVLLADTSTASRPLLHSVYSDRARKTRAHRESTRLDRVRTPPPRLHHARRRSPIVPVERELLEQRPAYRMAHRGRW